jgi:hypothetical protein
MKNLFFLSICSILFFSCSTKSNTPLSNKAKDSDLINTQTIAFLQSKGQYFNLSEFDRWQNFWNLNQHDFAPKTGKLQPTDVEWEPIDNFDFDTLYTEFFIFSPDSNYFLDLDSYNLALVWKDGKLVSYGFEVDTKIVLYDMKNRRYRTVFSCGTPCIIESAFWINETEFCLLGFEESDDDKLQKMVWRPRSLQFHVNSRQQMGDYFKTARDLSEKSYLKEIRLINVSFL